MAKTVVLGLSGGVDSAVAARLLVEEGYTVYGHWLDIGLWGREAAAEVAESIGIPFSAGDIRQELETEVMAPFQRDYLAGRTPLPCARCNPTVKFPALFRRAEEVGAQFVATKSVTAAIWARSVRRVRLMRTSVSSPGPLGQKPSAASRLMASSSAASAASSRGLRPAAKQANSRQRKSGASSSA